MFDVAIATSAVIAPVFEYTFSIVQLVMYFTQRQVYPESCDQGLRYLTPNRSCMLDANREKHVEEFLLTDCTHLCLIDADMGFAPNVLHMLASRRCAYVGCNYSMKNEEKREFSAMRKDRTARIQTEKKSTGLEEADFTGFGFVLIRRDVLERIEPPRFERIWNAQARRYSTEDAPFCHKVQQAGFPVYVDHDASKFVWHMGDYPYRWEDVSGPESQR